MAVGATDRWRWRAAVVLAPLLGYVLVTWPWVLRLWTQAPGRDGAAFVWSFWWARHALETWQSPLWTAHSFAPVGAPLVLNTGLPLPALASVPLQWLFGAPLAFNLTAVGLVVLASVATTALARDFGLERWPALFAGLAFAFSPTIADRYAYLEHLNLGGTVFWIPLVLLLARRWQRAPGWRRGVLLGIGVGGAAWSDQTVALMAVLAAVLYLLAALVAGRLPLRRALPGALAVLAVAVVVVAPIGLAIARGLSTGDLETDERENGARFYSVDLAGLVVGNPQNPVLGPLTEPLSARLGSRLDGANDLGIVLVALALVGLVARRRDRRARWLALLGLVGVALSLGPVLWVAGTQHVPLPVPGTGEGDLSALMPFTWLRRLPGLSGLRAPGRFSFLAALAVALLAGFGVQRLSRAPARTWVVAVVAVPLVLVEALSPVVNRLDAALPIAYQPVAADPDDVIVVDVPLGFSRGVEPVGEWSDIGGLAASVHGRRTAAGFASRLGDRRIERLLAIPLYRDLIALQEVPAGEPLPPTSPAEGAASAAEHRIRYVVLSEATTGAAAVRQYLTEACYEQVERAQGLALYRYACS